MSTECWSKPRLSFWGRASHRQHRCCRCASLLALAMLAQACLSLERTAATEHTTDAGTNQCTACHGDPSRSNDPVLNSAPPFDLDGNRDPSARGVGAHLNHLLASPTHEAIACNECHSVPRQVYATGHFDPAQGARITFGDSARRDGQSPAYETASGSCSGTYCHHKYAPDSNPNWQAPRDSLQACGSCHGVPPAPPHSQKADCSECHGQVIDASGRFINRALHLDGTVQVAPQCNSCHGRSKDGAPPPDLEGNTDVSAPGVGAHERHLQASASHGAVACDNCHAVPESWNTPGHIDGQRPADVRFSGLATQQGHANASYSADTHSCSGNYCHQNAVPVWIQQKSAAEACGSCHGLPPPFIAGVPISSGNHPKSDRCENCHGTVIAPDRVFIAPERHVNGKPDVADLTCTSCHGGGGSSAPPSDLLGNADVTTMGVGAHRAHLSGGKWGRSVACTDCHVVPEHVDDPGHIDDWTAAEVTFSGVAIAQNRTPTWNRQNGRCTNVWCHGADLTVTTSPVWTDPAVSLGCTSCHGMPPPAPHVQLTQCNLCHSNVRSDNTFVDRSLHVNGSLDY